MIAAKYSGSLLTTGRTLDMGTLFACLLVVLENIGMLNSLNGNISNTVSLLTFIFSVTKWLLALDAVLYILAAGSLLLFKKTGSSAS